MSELQNVQELLDEARRSADAGDLISAGALLQDAARIQEAELGPLHPELANTLNNLGVVAESQGQIGEAEAYYRRAVAITSAALAPDDPLVGSSRKNLEDFCRERGLPIDPPVAAPSMPRIEHKSDGVVHDHPADTRPVADSIGVADDGVPSPTAARTTKRRLAFVAIGLIVVIAATLVVMRPWSRRESSAPEAGRDATAPPTSEPLPAPTPAPATATAPIQKTQQPAVASPADTSSVEGAKPTSPRPSSGALTLVTSQLCRTFSASGNWRCEPAGQSVSPGAIVLYTRVKSPRNAIVIHRWYRGDTLRKSARLTILANPTDGYRTFSRQTVKSGENWRVEVMDTAGDVLYEQRVSVR